MLGAIIGDIVGSVYEFNNIKTKKFEFFNKRGFFTDDTVMTCAVANALINKVNIINSLKRYGRSYPYCGFGGSFRFWLMTEIREPYNSCGNGAAMRVSAVGWVAKSEEEVKELSNKVTGVTHDHPEGLKAAETVAMGVFMARNGASKEELRAYFIKQYPIVETFDYDGLVKAYYFTELAQNSVPQALFCFLISNNFEDCIRTTISIGGDCDTTAAISGAIAEAFYGIPDGIKQDAMKYFNAKDRAMLLEPINKIYKSVGKENYIPL